MESGKLSGIVNVSYDLLGSRNRCSHSLSFQWMICQVKPKTAALQERAGLPVREEFHWLVLCHVWLTRVVAFVVNELHNILQHDVQIVLWVLVTWPWEFFFLFGHATPEMSANITNLELAQQIYAGCDILCLQPWTMWPPLNDVYMVPAAGLARLVVFVILLNHTTLWYQHRILIVSQVTDGSNPLKALRCLWKQCWCFETTC